MFLNLTRTPKIALKDQKKPQRAQKSAKEVSNMDVKKKQKMGLVDCLYRNVNPKNSPKGPTSAKKPKIWQN